MFHKLFLKATYIRKNMQNDSSEFKGLLQNIMSRKPFINQDESYIIVGGEMK